MWFLEADIALRLLGGCVLWAAASALARKYWSQAKLERFLPILDLILIAYVSEWLAVFYAAYTAVTFGIAHLAGKGCARCPFSTSASGSSSRSCRCSSRSPA